MSRTIRLALATAAVAFAVAPAAPSHAVDCGLLRPVCQTYGLVCREVIQHVDDDVHMLACTVAA